MLAYHNDPAIKEKFIARFAAHRAADEVAQGSGRTCFVGCTLDRYCHSAFPTELGWPEWLAHLADRIFEGLPKAEAAQFGTDLLTAVPVGVDLDPVRYVIAIQRHTVQLARLEDDPEPYAEQCRVALRGVISYCENQLSNSFKNAAAAWSAARSAAESAWSAARSAAAWSAAESAWSAARSAAESAESAAESAWSAARSAAAWSAAWQTERDELLNAIRALA